MVSAGLSRFRVLGRSHPTNGTPRHCFLTVFNSPVLGRSRERSGLQPLSREGVWVPINDLKGLSEMGGAAPKSHSYRLSAPSHTRGADEMKAATLRQTSFQKCYTRFGPYRQTFCHAIVVCETTAGSFASDESLQCVDRDVRIASRVRVSVGPFSSFRCPNCSH